GAVRWLMALVGSIVQRRLRADWRQEWEAELRYRENLLSQWDRLNWKSRLNLCNRSLGAFGDALWLQQLRLEDQMFQDLRYGVRMLLKNPGFTFVAVVSLALGIGANTAMFSVVDALLLKSLPVPHPRPLVLFGSATSAGISIGFPEGSTQMFSNRFFRDAAERNQVFSGLAAVHSIPWRVHGIVDGNASGELEPINTQLVSGNYFSVLGVDAALGRVLDDSDDRLPGGHPIAVASNSWWQGRLGGDASAIGRTATIGETTYTIIGVAPREFFGTTVGESPDLWIPLAMEAQLPPGWKGLDDPMFQSLYLIGRLRPGVDSQQANAEANVLFQQFLKPLVLAVKQQALDKDMIELTHAGRGLSQLLREFSLPLTIVMLVVGVVLLIACANIANLLLARATARQREFSIRVALGATRIRLVRQLLGESALLASIGGAGGLLLGSIGSRLLLLMAAPGPEAPAVEVSPDRRVLVFTLAGATLSAIVFGTIPALRATRSDINDSLRGVVGAMARSSRSALGKMLVVAQIALSVLLLVGAGLFVRTLINLHSVDPGFKTNNLLVVQ